MDILSSQATLAGYKAVVSSLQTLKSNTNDDDSCWHCTCSKSFDSWCRCCWFTRHSNCKKDGAIVYATDVRIASKEQVESLGGKF